MLGRVINPWLLGISLLSGAPAHTAEFRLELLPKDVPTESRAALQTFLTETARQIPPLMAERIGRPVLVRFTREFGHAAELLSPPCAPEAAAPNKGTRVLQTRGQLRRGVILLNAALIPEILRGPSAARAYACGHRDLFRLAQATLLHELAHVYDFLDIDTRERQTLLALCAQGAEDGPAAQCQRSLLYPPRVVSKSPAFRSLMNWGTSARNTYAGRSPDPYELSEPEEAFAVNFEYFALDPEFACRKPSVFAYYRDHFGLDPHPNRACRLNTQVPLSQQTEEASFRTVDLDPARVYQIHYLFASRGPQLMSKFGHAMYRIVGCAPSRSRVGPECLNDIQHHVVVSFRGRPDESGISAWKGLTGGYPSLLYLFSFHPQIINEYTLDEPRDLISLPIAFDDAEKARFLENVLETYWTYQGRYYFLTNNCATEALNLLKRVLREPEFQALEVMTPMGLYDQLALRGLIDSRLVEPRAQGIKAGFLFPSNHQVFPDTYARLREANPAAFPWGSLEEFLQANGPGERRALYLRLKAGATDARLASRFLILETYVFRLARRSFLGQVSELVQQSQDPSITAKRAELLKLQGEVDPLAQQMGGYGIPFAREIPPPPVIENQESLVAEILAWASQALSVPGMPSFKDDFDAMAANRKFFLLESATRR